MNHIALLAGLLLFWIQFVGTADASCLVDGGDYNTCQVGSGDIKFCEDSKGKLTTCHDTPNVDGFCRYVAADGKKPGRWERKKGRGYRECKAVHVTTTTPERCVVKIPKKGCPFLRANGYGNQAGKSTRRYVFNRLPYKQGDGSDWGYGAGYTTASPAVDDVVEITALASKDNIDDLIDYENPGLNVTFGPGASPPSVADPKRGWGIIRDLGANDESKDFETIFDQACNKPGANQYYCERQYTVDRYKVNKKNFHLESITAPTQATGTRANYGYDTGVNLQMVMESLAKGKAVVFNDSSCGGSTVDERATCCEEREEFWEDFCTKIQVTISKRAGKKRDPADPKFFEMTFDLDASNPDPGTVDTLFQEAKGQGNQEVADN